MSCKQCNLLLQKVTVTLKSSSTQKDGSVTLTLKAGGSPDYDAGWTHHLHQVELLEGFQLDSVRADVAGLKHMGYSLIGKLLNHAKPAAVDFGWCAIRTALLVMTSRHGPVYIELTLVAQESCKSVHTLHAP